MKMINDPAGDSHFGIFAPFKATAAITRGSPVSVDSNGDIADSATATLSRVIGVAAEDIASGEVGLVQTYGYCDYLTTDGNLATTDLVVQALDGGIAGGATEAEITSDPTIAYAVFGRALGAADVGTVGICFIGSSAAIG